MGELLIILVIILLLFGAARLPEIARSLGKALAEFKKAAREVKDDLDTDKSAEKKPEEKK